MIRLYAEDSYGCTTCYSTISLGIVGKFLVLFSLSLIPGDEKTNTTGLLPIKHCPHIQHYPS